MKAAILFACFILSAGNLVSCESERKTYTAEQVTAYLYEDAQRIERLESKTNELESKTTEGEQKIGEMKRQIQEDGENIERLQNRIRELENRIRQPRH